MSYTEQPDEVVLAEGAMHSLVQELTNRLAGTPLPAGLSVAVVLVDTVETRPGHHCVLAVAHGNNGALNQRIPELLIADANKVEK